MGAINKITSVIGPDFSVVDTRCEYDDGIVERKKVPIELYMEALQKGLTNGEEDPIQNYLSLRGMGIPQNCYDLAFSKTVENSFLIAIVMDGDKLMPFCYQRRGEQEMQIYTVPMPPTIFFLKVGKGVLREASVFALDCKSAKDVTPETKLFHYPYSNVYVGGKICFGSNFFKELTIGTAESVCRTFFQSINNDDLFSPRTIGGKKNCSLQKLLEMVDGKGKYPKGLLVPECDSTVADFAAHFFTKN